MSEAAREAIERRVEKVYEEFGGEVGEHVLIRDRRVDGVKVTVNGEVHEYTPDKATAVLLGLVLAELQTLNANIEEVRERFAPRNLLHPRRRG